MFGGNLNDVKENGIVVCTGASTTNLPESGGTDWWFVTTKRWYQTSQQFGIQTAEKMTTNNKVCIRQLNNGTWGAWQELAKEASITNRFADISVSVGSDGLVPVSSNEHAVLIMVSGWAAQANGYAWVCTGYATGANRKYITNIGRTDLTNVTCTASETGYTIHNGANTTANVHIIYLMN